MNGKIDVKSENIFPIIKRFLYSDRDIFLRELVANAVDASLKMRTLGKVMSSELSGYKVKAGASEVADGAPLQGADLNGNSTPGVETPGCNNSPFQGSGADNLLTSKLITDNPVERIDVVVDKEAGTLSIADRGVGMTAEEVQRYICEMALSGATEFVEKYKEDASAIIGHFGLGFYSAFMVADRVEIFSQSFREGTKAVHWSCDGSPEYELEEVKSEELRVKSDHSAEDAANSEAPAQLLTLNSQLLTEKFAHGTTVVLHLSEDAKEYLEEGRIRGLLMKYCRFMPVEIYFRSEEFKVKSEELAGASKSEELKVKSEELAGAAEAAERPINDTKPLFMRAPKDVKDEEYERLYGDLFPMEPSPLFWIHLNVDFPFHLQGVLYFPHLRKGMPVREKGISLYQRGVFVTDEVEGIVPQYLTLLHGVIDSPDIPLNVSRSYLQSDGEVKKIAGYVTKKVCDRLASEMKKDRAAYEQKWEDLRLFSTFGVLADKDFRSRALKDFFLLGDVEGKFYTVEEVMSSELSGYQVKAGASENAGDNPITSKPGTDNSPVLVYATDAEGQYAAIEAAKRKGYRVLLMDGELDMPLLSLLEQEKEGLRAMRVDSDAFLQMVSERKEAAEDAGVLGVGIESLLPKGKEQTFHVVAEDGGADGEPLTITRDETMRRMKEMARLQGGAMSFYAEMPDMYTVHLNTSHPLVKRLDEATAEEKELLAPVDAEIRGLQARIDAISQIKSEDEKEKELNRQNLDEAHAALHEQQEKRRGIIGENAAKNSAMGRLVALSLLRAGLLKGKALEEFVSEELSRISVVTND